MNNKEYLNEEKYQKTRKKIVILAVVIFLVGLIIGGSLIVTGIKKASDVKSGSSPEAKEEIKAKKDKAKEEIQAKKDEINSELTTLKAKQRQEFKANGFSEEYYRIDNEIDSKEAKIAELDSQIWKIEDEYKSEDDSSQLQKYIPFYVFGGFIIFVFGMISLSIYMIAKRREMLAFSAQQVMPVAQEGIEKIAPTVGKAGASIAKEMAPVYGDIAKEISKGIKEGSSEEDKEK